MRKIYIFLLIFLIFSSLFNTVLGLESTEECLNGTHLETIIKWTECDTTCQDNNITQITNCTHGCNAVVNQCKYIRKSDVGDAVGMAGVTFITVMFFFLGMRVQPAKDFSMFKNGLQTLFFIVGFWLLILDISLVETIAVSSGVTENTFNLITTTIVVLSRILYIVMFFLFLSYLISVLFLFLHWKKRRI